MSKALGFLPEDTEKRKRKVATRAKPKRTGPSTTDTPTILIDDRAGSKLLIGHYPLNLCGELCRLDSGDALITGNGPEGAVCIGVEVKTIYDLISSIDTGRLAATQTPTMLEHYHSSWLLYYGYYREGALGELEVFRKGGWEPHVIGSRPVPYAYLTSFLFELSLHGVDVARVVTISEAAQWLGCLARFWAKPWARHKRMRTFDNSRQLALQTRAALTPAQDLAARMAKELPGLGYERAVAAAVHFGDTETMVLASEKEWREVEGVGKVVAKEVWTALADSRR